MTCVPISMAAGGRTELLANPTRAAIERTAMRRALVPFALIAALAMASPAMAAPTRDGGCPGPYEPATYAEFALEFPELLEAFGAEAFGAALAGFDNNSNGIVCWKDFPSVAKVYTTFLFHALVIDDAAVGLDD